MARIQADIYYIKKTSLDSLDYPEIFIVIIIDIKKVLALKKPVDYYIKLPS